ncbi:MAG: hypothetical protein JSV27_07065 [Candidatus Bathyarchaeota archaeon]|nr:MAG: hypothetical protein JSV27_07065 [Candidatus Bathyarchaeota archaeon]
MSERKRPLSIKILIVIKLFIAISSTAKRLMLFSDPSGISMGLDIFLDKIPFQSFILLGPWFIGPYGLLPAALAYGLYRGYLWVWRPSLLLAVVEVIWIIVQIPLFGGLGALQLFFWLYWACLNLFLISSIGYGISKPK